MNYLILRIPFITLISEQQRRRVGRVRQVAQMTNEGHWST